MVAAAEAMPAEKYSFKPSPEMNTFGHLTMHITQSNYTFCSKISGQAAPDVKIAETDAKDKLVGAMKDSFAFCTTALANVDDSKLGEQFMFFGNRPTSARRGAGGVGRQVDRPLGDGGDLFAAERHFATDGAAAARYDGISGRSTSVRVRLRRRTLDCEEKHGSEDPPLHKDGGVKPPLQENFS